MGFGIILVGESDVVDILVGTPKIPIAYSRSRRGLLNPVQLDFLVEYNGPGPFPG